MASALGPLATVYVQRLLEKERAFQVGKEAVEAQELREAHMVTSHSMAALLGGGAGPALSLLMSLYRIEVGWLLFTLCTFTAVLARFLDEPSGGPPSASPIEMCGWVLAYLLPLGATVAFGVAMGSVVPLVLLLAGELFAMGEAHVAYLLMCLAGLSLLGHLTARAGCCVSATHGTITFLMTLALSVHYLLLALYEHEVLASPLAMGAWVGLVGFAQAALRQAGVQERPINGEDPSFLNAALTLAEQGGVAFGAFCMYMYSEPAYSGVSPSSSVDQPASKAVNPLVQQRQTLLLPTLVLLAIAALSEWHTRTMTLRRRATMH
uniref:Uncharacterized protein n=2 Tax=Haptolina brevifila TaxID=156173 RepID=A0A7S2C1W4_9EUKA|mmetsp:Transcript_19284/g.39421  ORF Transcript_19284/g.39421 Transcript_19284/m.39421 type:complete len:322 (+) Transcript_19284:52-1017(+)